MHRRYLPYASVALGSFILFVLPVALFVLKFHLDAPFYFMAQDSFYYLSIAMHSAHVPFFSIDGVHPTNGFHPMWEWIEYLLSRTAYFRLDGPSILPRIFSADLLLVGTAVSLLSAYIYHYVRRGWIAVLAVCPGLFWLLLGIGAPAYLNNWAFVNGMETGAELLCFVCAALLFGSEFHWGLRFLLGTLCLGLTVLARLDDIFFVIAIATYALARSPSHERVRRSVAFLLPVTLIAGYLFYNHHTVGVWMPVSGMAKVGRGYRASVGETLRLLKGWPFWAMPPYAVAFSYANTYVMVAQMFGPMAVAATFFLWSRGRANNWMVLRAMAVGVLLKGFYNAVRVPIGYQGAWYYGVSIAVANVLLAVLLSDGVKRWKASEDAETWKRQGIRRAVRVMTQCVALFCLSALSFNIVTSRESQNGFAVTREVYEERAEIRNAISATGHPTFLEFQDGELSFATGLPSVSAFGLAADPQGGRAQQQGTYFDLLAQRGVTVAAASGTYPAMLSNSRKDKAIFSIWGFNREEIMHYRFDPFWSDRAGDVVLYHIVREP